MTEHTERITAVLAKLEATLIGNASVDAAAAARAPAPQSLFLLAHEVDQIEFHRTQLRHMYNIFKVDAHIIAAYSVQRGRSSGLTQRLAKLHHKFGIPAPTSSATATATARSSPSASAWLSSSLSSLSRKLSPAERESLARKETRVVLARVQTVKERLTRLQRLGRASPGRKEYENLKAELVELQAQARSRGLVKSEGESGEEVAVGRGAGSVVG
jgi:hypothetical protein